MTKNGFLFLFSVLLYICEFGQKYCSLLGLDFKFFRLVHSNIPYGIATMTSVKEKRRKFSLVLPVVPGVAVEFFELQHLV